MIDTYNYLSTTSYNRPASKSETSHNKKELKNLYNNIVKMNRESPLYMFDLSDDTQQFAVDIKESAYSLMDVLDQFGEGKDAFDKTGFSSSDENTVSVVVNDKHAAANLDDFVIRVDSLATGQTNEGRHVYSDSAGLTPGIYSFNVSVFDEDYSFQFPVSTGMSNYAIQDALSDFINSTHIGLNASVKADAAENKSYMVIESDFTGTPSEGEASFTIQDSSMINGRGIAEYFGLNNVSDYPSNSHFNLDGTARTLHGNTFTYNNAITVNLNSVNDTPVVISKTADPKEIIKSLNHLAESYNSLIDTANSQGTGESENSKLISSIRQGYIRFENDLEACGISFDSSGKMQFDESLITQAAYDGDLENLLTDNNGIIGSLKSKAGSISINPMEFVKKTIVTYPNTKVTPPANPYITSIYSGMLFNYYC